MPESLYKRRVAQGLCGSCGEEKIQPGESLGPICKEKSRQRTEARRAKNRKDRKCINNCGRPAVEGSTRCGVCLEKQRVARKQDVAKRKAEGRCVQSGCPNPPKEGCTLCQSCIDKLSKTSSKHYWRRKAAGTCLFDDNPPEPGHVLCTYHREKYRNYRRQLKLEALAAYHEGPGEPACAGCGCDDITILEIDHINGGGCKHRREVSSGGAGHPFYQWLKNQGYPPGYRVLCPTCNKKAHARVPLPNDP